MSEVSLLCQLLLGPQTWIIRSPKHLQAASQSITPFFLFYCLPLSSSFLLLSLFSLTHPSDSIDNNISLLTSSIVKILSCQVLAVYFFPFSILDIIRMLFTSILLSAAVFCLLYGAPLTKWTSAFDRIELKGTVRQSRENRWYSWGCINWKCSQTARVVGTSKSIS